MRIAFSWAIRTDTASMSTPRTMALPVRAAAIARIPVPVPISSTRLNLLAFSRASKAIRQPAVVAWWPVPKAAPASIRSLTALAGARPALDVWDEDRGIAAVGGKQTELEGQRPQAGERSSF